MWKKIKPFVISVAISLGVGLISALLTSDSMDIYSVIVQPPLAPPSILFPIVWTVLFTLMGIGAALVYKKKDEMPKESQDAIAVYAVNLFVNFFWSIIFFNMRAFLFSFIWLILLWAIILIMILKFRKVSPLAAYLQIPYLLWVAFAGYLNLAIFLLN